MTKPKENPTAPLPSFLRKQESRRRPCENREPEYKGTGCPIKNFGHDKYKTLDSVSSTE